MINSIKKGKRGELEFRDVLRKHGFNAERGAQRSGSPDSPDVRCDELPIHFEVKFTDRLDLRGAYIQASNECGKRTPVVAHRCTRGQWMVTLSAEDFLRLAYELYHQTF